MYAVRPFAENRIEVLQEFIRQHPLAALVNAGPEGLEATHLPLILDAGGEVLRGHMARANPQWGTLSGAAVLVLFTGADHYITPSWYPAKREHGRVVPTWNYVAVHVSGRAKATEDYPSLMRHLKELTDHNEAGFSLPWSVDDAPRDFIDGLTKSIVGIEISVERIEGKWKLSQNRSAADRQGVMQGLEEIGSPAGDALADVMRKYSGR